MRQWGDSGSEAGRTWFWVFLIVLTLSAVGSSYGSGDEKKAQGPVSQGAPSEQAASQEAPSAGAASGAKKSGEPDSLAEARQFFKRFERLERAFDSGLIDLYADNARIVAVRVYPNGKERTMELTGTRYKALLAAALPVAAARRDVNRYSRMSYRAEEGRVTIEGTRTSLLKGYSAPYRMAIRRDGSGVWRVVEERSVSRP